MSISQHDREVLNRIFNPDLPSKEAEESTENEEVFSSDLSVECKHLELAGVRAAEKGELAQAIDCFTRVISEAPQYASAYNNRAQALRLKGDIDGALNDLNTAIELSDGKGRVASQALTQRAMIRRLRDQSDEALQDFKQASVLGNDFARKMVVAMNPYAALCNQMMHEIVERECRGQSGSATVPTPTTVAAKTSLKEQARPTAQEMLGLLGKVSHEEQQLQQDTKTSPGNQKRVLPLRVNSQEAVVSHLTQLLKQPGPYPMVVLTSRGEGCGYWVEDGSSVMRHDPAATLRRSISEPCSTKNLTPSEQSQLSYRTHFLGKEHFNFLAYDEAAGPVVMSIKAELVSNSEYIRIILRYGLMMLSHRKKSGTHFALLPCSAFKELPSPSHLARTVCSDLTTKKFTTVLCDKVSDLLLHYDEHGVSSHFKFGVLSQQLGQVKEEQLFSNKSHSAAMDDFLHLLGDRVRLKHFQGFRGGLDTQHDHTGETSVYTKHEGKEIMFHVSTLLPHSDTDHQQLQRKRHIGNDIVAVIFQEANTPFSPEMIASNFLHAYVIVQPSALPSGELSYKVSVVARNDVPYFGPPIPAGGHVGSGTAARQFFLHKLICAEQASYRASKFAALQERTRVVLFEGMYEELLNKTEQSASTKSSEAHSIMVNFRWAFPSKLSKKRHNKTTSKASADTLRHIHTAHSAASHRKSATISKRHSQGSSRQSVTLPVGLSASVLSQHADDVSTTASFSSSSSSSTDDSLLASFLNCATQTTPGDSSVDCGYDTLQSLSGSKQSELEMLRAEVHQLKLEKLELLKQAVASQREIRVLRERESQMVGELRSTQRELCQMKAIVLDMSQEAAV